MRPRERREAGEQDLFRSRLDQIIDMKHALVSKRCRDHTRRPHWRYDKPLLSEPIQSRSATSSGSDQTAQDGDRAPLTEELFSG
jgi:hypothetical protein